MKTALAQSRIAQVLEGDPLADTLCGLIQDYRPRTILDIGASDGTGSTQIMHEESAEIGSEIYCIELDPDRFAALKRFASERDRITEYYCASVKTGLIERDMIIQASKQFPNWDAWRSVGLQYMLDWYDRTMIVLSMVEITDGINYIKNRHGITDFDMVLMDGSPFSGMAELQLVLGSDVIVMDDVNDIKCHEPYHYMMDREDYQLHSQNLQFRNGFAVFKKCN